MGFAPELWGRQGWHFIHYIALNYPNNPSEEIKNEYLNFFNSLGNVLPCPFCGIHFKENMVKHPPRLESKEAFFNWTVDMHNFVNKENGKKKLTYSQAFKQTERNSKSTEMVLKHFFKEKEYVFKGVMLSALITTIIFFGAKRLSKI
jgi:hypothetical protein